MTVRKWVLLAAVVVGLIAAAAMSFAPPRAGNLLLLDWANKAKADKPPTAVLIEMGLKDDSPTDWSGRATVSGAKVVGREGYRFWEDDKLKEPDAWEASSHHGRAVPKGQPAVVKQEGIATVGVVLHLADATADAVLTVHPEEKGKPAVEVPLKEVLAGKHVPIWGGDAVVRLVTTATALTDDKTEDDFPAAAYGPDGTLWVVYIAYKDRHEARRIEAPNLKEQPENFKGFVEPGYADQLFVKYYREGKWSEPIAVTEGNEDLKGCAIAVRGDGVAWVIYSAHRNGRFDIFAHALTSNFAAGGKDAVKVQPEQRWTTAEKSAANLSPTACTMANGSVWTAFQRWNDQGTAVVEETICRLDKRADKDEPPPAWIEATNRGNCWRPSITAGPPGQIATPYDTYVGGDYDVGLDLYNEGGVSTNDTIVHSPLFEARPSACYDTQGRLWIAYEEGPEKWGKDFGALAGDGNPLYNARYVRVVCLEDGKLMEPVAELPTLPADPPRPDRGKPVPFEKVPRYSNPALGLDGKGRLWLTYRQKFGTRYTTHPGSYWLTFARRLDGDHWTDPVEVAHSDGLLDETAVILPHPAGGVYIVHNTDGRHTTPHKIQNMVYVSTLDLPGDPVEPKLRPRDPGKKGDDAESKAEQEAVKRIRDYRVEANGKKYQPLRGDFHRHTDLSWDGGPDGSLDDQYRYAIDAAAFDWLADTDHDNGAGREYPWWLTQKDDDAYFVADHFTPLFSYERSVAYPHGHRNVMFAQRGVLTLPRLAATNDEKKVAGVSPDDTRMLYRYLKELGGICASHTSATSMGTDWRDNDPDLEPIVEIYQGDRDSYEYPDAPRAGHDPKGDVKPAAIGGWEPKGFINNAFDAGYKFGFEASSDHWSTHISYSIALAEKHDRAGILDAFRKRHCYAATDNIILDVRSGEHIQGDAFQAVGAPKLDVHVIGTADLEAVDVLRDSKVAATLKADGRECKATWTDPKPEAGKHYYYVRVTQKDKALAWGSPMWIDSGP